MDNDNKKSGFVAIIGSPNVGKSTLMNHLIGQKVAITSRKPQTTRNKILSIYTCGKGQIVFLDTPGIHKAKSRLGEYMISAVKKSLVSADAVLWLMDPSSEFSQSDRTAADMLSRSGLPVLIAVNKIDKVKKKEVPALLDSCGSLFECDEVIAISAKHGINLDILIDAIFKYLPYGPLYYDEDEVTDQPIRQIAAEMIREKALRRLGDEVPHSIAVVIERMKERPDKKITDIDAAIICAKESHKGIIIGKNGQTLKLIGSDARKDIERMTDSRVNLSIRVKFRKQWQNSEILLKHYGYDKREL